MIMRPPELRLIQAKAEFQLIISGLHYLRINHPLIGIQKLEG